jgi:tellurite resistance protein
MMRIGDFADATAAACWWLEEIDGLITSAERRPIETNGK